MKNNYKAYLLFLGLAFGLTFGIAMFVKNTEKPNSITEIEKTKTLRHVVLFKFKEGTSPEELKAIEAAFSDLPSKIPEIIAFEWGLNNSPEGLDKGFTHCFFVSFKDEQGRETYLPHSDHKAFVDLASPHIEDVLVVDYWTD
ncbi:Dabb family protein [Muricauda sp. SCSIO 64092]|uniref:Dabb family protein n=1 Tax=Allomuricauda sp. SCSIO 64092 TaxID=2908842 RepID=UPI001FF65148|nr:Dabb family protein [Muricauda sp. SCSIO 64092]UOY05577.1 Dabb family protein [Muricauda sp. SCSIO 64092]